MKKILVTALLGCLVFPSAHAALIDRGGGLIYDDFLDITWWSNAAEGGVFESWDDAKAWADSATLGGFGGWRLPSAYDVGTENFCEGFNCTESEMGRMFYINFGAVAGNVITSGSNTAYLALFQNLTAGANRYALNEEFNEDAVWQFRNDGIQSYGGKVQGMLAWVVHEGDIGKPGDQSVPEPGAMWLLLPGLAGLGVMRRRSRKA